MRVLYLCAIAGIGGAERSLLDLLGRLPRDQVTPVLLVPAAGALSHEAARMGIRTEVVSWPGAITALGRERHMMNRLRLLAVPFLLPPFVLRLTVKIRALGADLVHTNGTRAHIAGTLACLMARRPVVWHIRDVLQPGLLRSLMRALGAWVPRIIANSAASASTLGRGRAARRTVIVYNGIDVEAFVGSREDARLRAELGLDRDAFVITTVGALAPLKGHLHLLRAMPRVLQELPAARLLVVGEEMYATAGHSGYGAVLREEAARLGIAPHVVFAGSRSDMAAVYAASDAVVLASVRPESFGRVLIEAMASRRPVIATDLGGPREIIACPELGVLVPPGDSGALAGALVTLGRDPALRQRLGAAGLAQVTVRFGIERHVKQVLEIYGAVLAARSPQPALVT